MSVIVCVENRDGISFGNRRLSSDKKVIEDIAKTYKDKTIHIEPNSKELFKDVDVNLIIEENCLENINDEDIYFIENDSVNKYKDKIKELVIYRWNRTYPSDQQLKIDYSRYYILTAINSFEGNSHERITRETYTKI